jgi:1,4-dihydroxy-2-naphthoyl-CoA hydrolase
MNMKEELEKIVEKNNSKTVFYALGISLDKLDPDQSQVSLIIDDRHRQHMGIVHGGIYVLLAESAASMAGACALKEAGVVVGLEINANHLRSTQEGRLIATSKSIHQGRSTMVYEVRIIDENNNLISISRCTLMVKKF